MSTDAMSIKFNADEVEEEDEEEEDLPDSVPSLRLQNPRVRHVPLRVTSASPTAEDLKRTTAVDGKGMFRSWTRVYSRPESACLDLLDNCFDAALQLTDDNNTEENNNQHFQGRVTMERHFDTAISIQNNSPLPIKPLKVALTVYKSSKNANLNGNAASRSAAQDNQGEKKDSIGENGVGLKQGCATLSDCSIVLMRNKRTVEIGVIAESLQTQYGIYLPSVSFNVRENDKDPHAIAVDAGDRIRKWLSKHPEIVEALGETFCEPSMEDEDAISYHLTQLVKRLWVDPWQNNDHVFLLFLFKLKKSAEVEPAQHDLMEDGVLSPAKAFIRDMKKILPEHYINLPSKGNFDFIIDQERIEFSFWQRRLVELTKFQINLPTDEPFENLSKEAWDQLTKESVTNNADGESTDGKGKGMSQMSIYCGFDAQRVDEDLQLGRGTSTCHLYIYSCQAGRLITKVIDARHMLGLVTSGVDFTQGLTIIINDVAGNLPLTPTKDGIAWSERKNGEIHQNNLMAWTGALAHFFWTHHRNRIGGRGGNNVKEKMKNLIQSFASKEQKEQMMDSSVTVTENIEKAQFTKFEGMKWHRIEPNYDNRWKIRKASTTVTATRGSDTLFSLVRPQTKRKRCTADAGRSARRRKGGLNTSNEQDENAAISDSWKEIDQKDIPRVASAVLAFFRSVDEKKLFEVPVLESLPHIKDEYLKVVSQPMDFKTIEERIPAYASITNLRDDLILTFQNSILFNGPESKFGQYAQQMLDELDDAIEATDIKRITMRALSYFREIDQRELFAFPVLEQVPELRDSYLEVVKTPMDFKTIEEERVHSYTAISDLEDDLELIWDNCIRFNGPASVYGQIAQQMKDMADDIVYDVVLGKRMKKRKVRYDLIVDPADDSKEKTAPRTKTRKKMTYNALQKQLHNTQKELEATRAENQHLRDQIVALEANHQPCRAPASASHTHDTSQEATSGCLVCHRDSDYASILLCERCDAEYHFYCVGLPTVPTDDFYCSKCLRYSMCPLLSNNSISNTMAWLTLNARPVFKTSCRY